MDGDDARFDFVAACEMAATFADLDDSDRHSVLCWLCHRGYVRACPYITEGRGRRLRFPLPARRWRYVTVASDARIIGD